MHTEDIFKKRESTLGIRMSAPLKKELRERAEASGIKMTEFVLAALTYTMGDMDRMRTKDIFDLLRR